MNWKPSLKQRRFVHCAASLPALAAITATCLAQFQPAAKRPEPTPENYRANSPFLTACIEGQAVAADGRSRPNIANKGVAILLAPGAAVCFDTDLLRINALP